MGAFYILEGELIFIFDDQRVSAPPGTFVLVPPGVRHRPSRLIRGIRGADSVAAERCLVKAIVPQRTRIASTAGFARRSPVVVIRLRRGEGPRVGPRCRRPAVW
jgi:hypothetical protein